MSLLVVGSVAYDSVETPFGKKERILGGSASFFSSAASYFTPVQLVAVVGRDFEQAHLDYLRARGVDLSGLTTDNSGDSFFWRGKYDYDLNNCQTLETRLNVFESFKPQIPEQFKNAEFVFLANIDPVLQSEVLNQIKKPKFVAMDTMNFWIHNKRDELINTIKRVNLLFVNDAEARLLAQEYNLVKAAQKLMAFGPQYVVIKQGEYGALLLSSNAVFRASAYPLEVVFDPTGAGDSFAGGMMGYISHYGTDFETLKKAVISGSVLASFAVEDFSVDRFRTLKREEIYLRFQAFHQLTYFNETLSLPRDPTL